ncbi:hypothetical protein AAMO2058_000433600 [Amorphochlora amoebiformis]
MELSQATKKEQSLNAMVDEFLRLRKFETAHSVFFNVCGISGGMGLSRKAMLHLSGLDADDSSVARKLREEVRVNTERSVMEIAIETLARHRDRDVFAEEKVRPGVPTSRFQELFEREFPGLKEARWRDELEAEVQRRVSAKVQSVIEREREEERALERARGRKEMGSYKVEIEALYRQKLAAEKRHSNAMADAWKEKIKLLQTALDHQKTITLQAAREIRTQAAVQEKLGKENEEKVRAERDAVAKTQREANERLRKIEEIQVQAELEVTRARHEAQDTVRRQFGARHRKLEQDLQESQTRTKEQQTMIEALREALISEKQRATVAEQAMIDAKRRAVRVELAQEEIQAQAEFLRSAQQRRLQQSADVQRELGRLQAEVRNKTTQLAEANEHRIVSNALVEEKLKLARVEGRRETSQKLDRIREAACRSIAIERIKQQKAQKKWRIQEALLKKRLTLALKILQNQPNSKIRLNPEFRDSNLESRESRDFPRESRDTLAAETRRRFKGGLSPMSIRSGEIDRWARRRLAIQALESPKTLLPPQPNPNPNPSEKNKFPEYSSDPMRMFSPLSPQSARGVERDNGRIERSTRDFEGSASARIPVVAGKKEEKKKGMNLIIENPNSNPNTTTTDPETLLDPKKQQRILTRAEVQTEIQAARAGTQANRLGTQDGNQDRGQAQGGEVGTQALVEAGTQGGEVSTQTLVEAGTQVGQVGTQARKFGTQHEGAGTQPAGTQVGIQEGSRAGSQKSKSKDLENGLSQGSMDMNFEEEEDDWAIGEDDDRGGDDEEGGEDDNQQERRLEREMEERRKLAEKGGGLGVGGVLSRLYASQKKKKHPSTPSDNTPQDGANEELDMNPSENPFDGGEDEIEGDDYYYDPGGGNGFDEDADLVF